MGKTCAVGLYKNFEICGQIQIAVDVLFSKKKTFKNIDLWCSRTVY